MPRFRDCFKSLNATKDHKARERITNLALTGRENRRMRDGAHMRRKNSIQVGVRFGFNDRVTVAGLRFQARAIKKSDHSSTVTNKLGRL